MSAHQHTLAQSQRYRIYHEFEAVFLDTPDRKSIVIGDFYGGPTAAIIDRDERCCEVVGCGITLYYLRSPFQPYQIDARSPQWATFHSGATDTRGG
ncbi:hypothetical protein F8S13_01310 [Chloroflexia bacterium SDU3-3]|nr:hypothetical protein F8S13_01310 [Chloroflexia bacterium SDU3-3]